MSTRDGIEAMAWIEAYLLGRWQVANTVYRGGLATKYVLPRYRPQFVGRTGT